MAVAAAIAGPEIPPHRLDDDRSVDADLLGLAAGEEVEIRAGDDNGRPEDAVLHPQQGLLIGRTVSNQRQELLGQRVARNRPQPGAGAAGKQDRDNRRGHWCFGLAWRGGFGLGYGLA